MYVCISCRLFVESRGERDLRRPGNSVLGVLVEEESKKLSTLSVLATLSDKKLVSGERQHNLVSKRYLSKYPSRSQQAKHGSFDLIC